MKHEKEFSTCLGQQQKEINTTEKKKKTRGLGIRFVSLPDVYVTTPDYNIC
jgi:hypothetical protein